MPQTTILTVKQDAFLFQIGAVMYQNRLYSTIIQVDKRVVDMVQDFVSYLPERIQMSIFHAPEKREFDLMAVRYDEHNNREGLGIKVAVEDYPKHQYMRPWWVMVQRAWRAWREMLKARQECFETFVLGTHARLGAGSVVLQFPVDLLGRVYDQLLPSGIRVKACVGES